MSQPAHHGHSSSQPEGENQPLVGHLVPLGTLLGTGFALIVLTVVTVAVRWIDLGEFNIMIALAIAFLKATLVALFFMHLRWDRPFNSFTFVGSLAFVTLFMAFALIDTHAYQLERDTGNATGAQAVLNASSPDAPITKAAAPPVR
jgi:cytochrome c oxidase subunit 4